MSDAKVTFTTLHGAPAAPGEEVFVNFVCPKGNTCGGLPLRGRIDAKHDPQNQNGGIAQWQWDGNRERPTLSPSVNCKGCWHGYIENGRCVNTHHQDEPEPPARRK